MVKGKARAKCMNTGCNGRLCKGYQAIKGEPISVRKMGADCFYIQGEITVIELCLK